MPDPVPPTVSVIIPTFNRLPLLPAAVQSVLSQDYTDFELIVIDDGSTDGTREYLESIDDPRLRVLSVPHGGRISVARNHGVRAARGEWLAFLDSDDVWLPGKLTLQLDVLGKNPKYGWCGAAYQLVDANDEPMAIRSRFPHFAFEGWVLPLLLNYSASVTIPVLVVRRSIVEEVGLFDESLVSREDYDLALKIATRSPVIILADVLARVREHPGRTTATEGMFVKRDSNARVLLAASRRAADPAVNNVARKQARAQRIALLKWLLKRGQVRTALTQLPRLLD
jgi:glycosyltransferase involved in cell wall biosynthesis